MWRVPLPALGEEQCLVRKLPSTVSMCWTRPPSATRHCWKPATEPANSYPLGERAKLRLLLAAEREASSAARLAVESYLRPRYMWRRPREVGPSMFNEVLTNFGYRRGFNTSKGGC